MNNTETVRKFADEVTLLHLRDGIDPGRIFGHPYSENFAAVEIWAISQMVNNALDDLADFVERAIRED